MFTLCFMRATCTTDTFEQLKPLGGLHNNVKNKATVNMTVPNACNLQYLGSKVICATAWNIFFDMRDLHKQHVGRGSLANDNIYVL